MLEEALRDPKKNPAEVSQAMLSFVRSDLPNGGTSSEERFFALFSLLCSRVFGPMQDEKGGYRHEGGGWLSAQVPWRVLSSSMRQQQTYGGSRAVAGGRVNTSIDADPVVQLLGPAVTPDAPKDSNKQEKGNFLRSLIEAITEEAESRPGVLYPFPFPALPAPMQQQFLLVLESQVMNAVQNPALNPPQVGLSYNQQKPAGMSHNSERLFGQLMRVSPEGQNQVRSHQQQKFQQKDQNQPLQLSPGLSPSPASPSSTTQQAKQEKDTTPNLILSMIEYYLFLFLRYPLFVPSVQIPQQSQAQIGAYQATGTMYRSRSEPPYGERVYFNLLCRYVRHFLPHTNEFEENFKQMGSEFFLRLLIAFWLESQGATPTTSKSLQAIHERYQRSGIHNAPSVDLNMSYDLAYGKFEPPPPLAQKCLRSLVIHLLTDPSIYRTITERNWGSKETCLSPGMSALQQPFYNFVRTTLRHASIHSQGSVFYMAMNMWLIWLEPWNVQHAKTKDFAKNASQLISSISGSSSHAVSAPGLTIPSADRKSTYEKSWEPYLASNLFLYTVPLAIFLRRARELDFSPREFNRSMMVVKRVFRVYTPELISALNNLTESLMDTGRPDNQLSKMVKFHCENLNDYAPSTQGNLMISSCQSDMQGLLEEVYMQHVKRVKELGALDKFAAFLEGFFGQGVVSGEEKAIHFLVERAKVIVGLPINFEILSGDVLKDKGSKGKSDTADAAAALRTREGLLTDKGRQQLLSGRYKCSPTEVSYVGDKMNARINSHEIAFLVPLTINLSTWANKKFGFIRQDGKASPPSKDANGFVQRLKEKDVDAHFRFNLRFLADYRNLLFISFLLWIAKKWLII